MTSDGITPDVVEPEHKKLLCDALLHEDDEGNVEVYGGMLNTSSAVAAPRGFAKQMHDGMKALGYEVNYENAMVGEVPDGDSITYARDIIALSDYGSKLRGYQISAIEAMLENRQGIYQAPPGSGKTITTLGFAKLIKGKSLIIVDKTNLLYQWRDRLQQFYGDDAGIIGDGINDADNIEQHDIYIATIQTLWSILKKSKKLDDKANSLERNVLSHYSHDDAKSKLMETSVTFRKFMNNFSMVCVDECHHVTAKTMFEVLSHSRSVYRFGVSGTPDRFDGRFKIAKLILGDVFHKTEKQDLVDAGVLVKPKVRRMYTEFGSLAEHNVDINPHYFQRDWNRLINKVVKNDDRNNSIGNVAFNLAKGGRSKVLIIAKRLEHVKRLEAICEANAVTSNSHMFLVTMTGEDTAEDRKRKIQIIENCNNGAILISTIADEALDIPCLDVVILAHPSGNKAILQQRIGRIERTSENKEGAIVIDVVDRKHSMLAKQASRREMVYREEKLEIDTVSLLRRPII